VDLATVLSKDAGGRFSSACPCCHIPALVFRAGDASLAAYKRSLLGEAATNTAGGGMRIYTRLNGLSRNHNSAVSADTETRRVVIREMRIQVS
jgi:hypothetical protein